MEKRSRNTQWNSDTVYALGFYRLITKCVGIWPFDCHKIVPLIQFNVAIVFELIMIASILGAAKHECNFATDHFLATALISSGALTIIKLILIRLNRYEISEIILSAINDWVNVKNLEARKVMKKYSQLGRTVFIFQAIFGGIATILFILRPFITPTVTSSINSTFVDMQLAELPVQNFCFDRSLMSYIALYILQSVQIFLLYTVNVGGDCYYFGMTMHVVGQFECLSMDFEKLGRWKNAERYRKDLAECIQRHITLLKLSQNLEDTFNIISLFQISSNIMQICTTGLRMIISIKTKDFTVALNLILIIQVLTVQMFFYCYAGIRLTSAAQVLHTSIYFSNWYELPSSLARDSVLVILRASKTFSLTAGHIIDMNLESFTSIMKALGSYFSVLQAMLDV